MEKIESIQLGATPVALGWCEVALATVEALSPAEREAWKRGKTEKRRSELAAGRIAARRAIRGLSPPGEGEILAKPDGPDAGRPCLLPEQGVSLSISHAGGWAVAAARRGEAIGVDLEECAPRDPSFAGEAFAEGELEAFGSLLPGDPVNALWALKEAVLKVWGVGLRAPLRGVCLAPGAARPVEEGLELALQVRTGELPVDLSPAPRSLHALLVRPSDRLVLVLAGLHAPTAAHR